MFRVKDSELEIGLPMAAWIVLSMHLMALLIGVGAFLTITWEYRLLSRWFEGAGPLPLPVRGTVRGLTLALLGGTLVVAATQVLGIVAFLRLRRRYESSQRSLHRVKLLAHDILASMEQGVVTSDREGTITSINSGAIRLLGIDFDCVGQPLERIDSPDVPLVELARQVAEHHEPVRDREFRLGGPAGVRRLLANAHDLKDTRGEMLGCVIHLRDVTVRALMKEQMWRMEQLVSLSTLATGLHHEIKNPLTAISIHVQLLEERLRDPAYVPATGEVLGVLKCELQRLNGVLESFRDFASFQRLEPRPADPLAILGVVVGLMGPQAEAQGVRITLRRPSAGPPPVPLDPEKVETAVLNLVINALEAMPSGGDLTLGAEAVDGELRVEVSDTGPGIPPEMRDHIFEPYFSTKARGTGMGLALAEKLVRQHGGRVDVKSGAGGTTFRIFLPLAQKG